MIILSKSDFAQDNSFAIAQSNNDNLQSFIDDYELPTLNKLLGSELASLFVADLTVGVPSEARFEAIFEPFATSQDISMGIKYILKSAVYYHIISRSQIFNTQSGQAVIQVETASTLTPSAVVRNAESVFNGMLESWDAIQEKCKDDPDTYPEFCGQVQVALMAGGL